MALTIGRPSDRFAEFSCSFGTGVVDPRLSTMNAIRRRLKRPAPRSCLRDRGLEGSGLSLPGHAQGSALCSKIGQMGIGQSPRCSKIPVRTRALEAELGTSLATTVGRLNSPRRDD